MSFIERMAREAGFVEERSRIFRLRDGNVDEAASWGAAAGQARAEGLSNHQDVILVVDELFRGLKDSIRVAQNSIPKKSQFASFRGFAYADAAFPSVRRECLPPSWMQTLQQDALEPSFAAGLLQEARVVMMAAQSLLPAKIPVEGVVEALQVQFVEGLLIVDAMACRVDACKPAYYQASFFEGWQQASAFERRVAACLLDLEPTPECACFGQSQVRALEFMMSDLQPHSEASSLPLPQPGGRKVGDTLRP